MYASHMKQFLFAILTAFFAIVATPASAHRPYFTQVGKIALPNGRMGEARLLNGDGILGPDPVRVLILDAGGKLLARSHQSRSMTISCKGAGHCLIMDHSSGKVLVPDPAAFRNGPPVPGLADEDRNDLWDLEAGVEHWGFVSREATLTEMLAGYWMLIWGSLPLMLFNMAVGAFCVGVLAATIFIKRSKRTRIAQTVAAIFAVILLIGCGLFVSLLSSFFTILGGISASMWLLSFGFGAALGYLCLLNVKCLRRKPVLDTSIIR